MKPFDRMLCVSAGLLGLAVFVLTARNVGNGAPGWEMAVGITALLVGLVALSLVTWRGRWR